jgi:hypothetical protein
MLDQEIIKEKLINWIINFLEVPNQQLNNWAPCPFARQARIKDNISYKFCTLAEFTDVLRESIYILEQKDVVVICFDHTHIDPLTLQKWVEDKNKMLKPAGYVILEDHPNALEFVNGVKMNFGYCGLLLMQKLDKLNIASEQLRNKGYYDIWSKDELDSVVTWR